MRRLTSIAALCGALLGCMLSLISPMLAAAHETRTIADGQYQIAVGFMDEPVYVGDKSGLEFRVTEASPATPAAASSHEEHEEEEGAPLEGLEETLQAEVIFADQTLELPLLPAFDEPGSYFSVFFPTQPGDYTFRIYGTIGDTEIDESFSPPEGFDSVQDPAPLQFPKL